ncbi:MAG: hypothetical protein IPJ39_14465 [Saprospiraceae bacterium]|nr:hypothetical protein [Saprospiraceae bacterium]
MKIGSKVGIPAHGKCQHLFEMAGSASVILNTVETNAVLNDPSRVTQMLNMNPVHQQADE